MAGDLVVAAERPQPRSVGGAALRVPQWVRSQQRVWKRQPAGGFTGDGTSPSRMIRCRCSRSFGVETGTAESRAIV